MTKLEEIADRFEKALADEGDSPGTHQAAIDLIQATGTRTLREAYASIERPVPSVLGS